MCSRNDDRRITRNIYEQDRASSNYKTRSNLQMGDRNISVCLAINTEERKRCEEIDSSKAAVQNGA